MVRKFADSAVAILENDEFDDPESIECSLLPNPRRRLAVIPENSFPRTDRIPSSFSLLANVWLPELYCLPRVCVLSFLFPSDKSASPCRILLK